MQMPPSRRNSQDRHLVRLHTQVLRDLLRHRAQGDLYRPRAFHVQRFGQSLQFRHQTCRHRNELFYPSAGKARGPAKMIPSTLLSCSTLSPPPATIFQIPCAFPAPAFVAAACPERGRSVRRHFSPPQFRLRQILSTCLTCKPFPNSLYWMCCKSIAPLHSRSTKILGLLRRRGHVFHGNPA
jgi:hypothetical protein